MIICFEKMPAVAKLNHHFMRHLFELMWHYLAEYHIKLYVTCQVRIHYSSAVSVFLVHSCNGLSEKFVFLQYFSAYCVPGTVLGAELTA